MCIFICNHVICAKKYAERPSRLLEVRNDKMKTDMSNTDYTDVLTYAIFGSSIRCISHPNYKKTTKISALFSKIKCL